MTKLSKKAKKIKETKPLLPFVNKEQILAFKPEKIETFTKSIVLNEVLLAIEVKKFRTTGEIAAYLSVDSELLRHTMQLETGFKVNDVIRMRLIDKLMRIKEKHASISPDDAARAVGYYDHSAIFKILGREEYDKWFAMYKRTHYGE